MEYINLEIERKVIKCLFHHKDTLLKMMNKGNFKPKVFSDKSFRIIYSNVVKHYVKTGQKLPLSALNAKVNRMNVDNKDKLLMKEKLESVIDGALARKPTLSDVKNFPIYIDEMNLLFQGRQLQDHTMKLFDCLDKSQIEEAKELQNTFQISDTDDNIDSAEMSDNFIEREHYILERFRNPEKYKLFKTGIKSWDEALGGGLAAELMIIAGSSNAGKSFSLQQISANAKLRGEFAIIFTIEMQKLETQFRIDTNLAGMDSKFFRNPAKEYTLEMHQKWKKKYQRIDKAGGRLYVVAYKQGATMESMRAQAIDIMNREKRRLDAIIIDYLDDVETVKKHKEEKSWTSFGEISWDMHLMAKHFPNYDGTDGVSVISANQLKKSSKEVSTSDKEGKVKRKLDERDTGSSPLPYRHSDVYMGIQSLIPDKVSHLVMMKGRAISKDNEILVYHNFAHGRFHDDAVRMEYEEAMEEYDESKELGEEIELEKPEE